jgi:hypothetical protein
VGWESRGNRFYYYRSRKVGGRVVKEYCGGGFAGQLAADADQRERAEASQRDTVARRLDGEVATVDVDVARLSKFVDALTADVLHAAGFYRHHRGEWRRRSGGVQEDG